MTHRYLLIGTDGTVVNTPYMMPVAWEQVTALVDLATGAMMNKNSDPEWIEIEEDHL